MSKVTREEALRELSNIVAECYGYAKHHDLAIIISREDEDDENIRTSVNANDKFLWDVTRVYVSMLHPDRQGVLADEINGVGQEPKKDQKKWSILWGLVTSYK